MSSIPQGNLTLVAFSLWKFTTGFQEEFPKREQYLAAYLADSHKGWVECRKGQTEVKRGCFVILMLHLWGKGLNTFSENKKQQNEYFTLLKTERGQGSCNCISCLHCCSHFLFFNRKQHTEQRNTAYWFISSD